MSYGTNAMVSNLRKTYTRASKRAGKQVDERGSFWINLLICSKHVEAVELIKITFIAASKVAPSRGEALPSLRCLAPAVEVLHQSLPFPPGSV
jgi:hypothetical protein